MTRDEPPRPQSEVLGSLPRTRPHRRSSKRDSPAASARKPAPAPRTKPRRSPATKAAPTPRKPRQAAATAKASPRRPDAVRPSAATRNASAPPRSPRSQAPPGPPDGLDVIGTAVQAAGELVGLGVTLGTQAVRGALRRLPRP